MRVLLSLTIGLCAACAPTLEDYGTTSHRRYVHGTGFVPAEPEVVGPGDFVTFNLAEPLSCYRWRAKSIKIDPEPVTASDGTRLDWTPASVTSQEEPIPGRVESDFAPRTLWARFRVPDDDSLCGKELGFTLSMEVAYADRPDSKYIRDQFFVAPVKRVVGTFQFKVATRAEQEGYAKWKRDFADWEGRWYVKIGGVLRLVGGIAVVLLLIVAIRAGLKSKT